ncbi:MAG: hypothetical protein HOP08_08075 [Cyclobacteriaceae bacterium]|nr:hypothetical protein [Cyclobacteriaceae bacterium]
MTVNKFLLFIFLAVIACSEDTPPPVVPAPLPAPTPPITPIPPASPVNVATTTIEVTPATLSLVKGVTSQLTATITPADATDKSITWSSSSNAVATVNSTGQIAAIASGTTTITATQGSLTSSCTVIVTDNDQIALAGAVWNLFNTNVYSIKSNNGATLQLDLARNALWFNNSEGGLIHRMVTGDFTLTATVSSVKRTNNSQEADCMVCLGGLMVRNPASTNADEDYVHLVTGITPGGRGAETKNTTNSASLYSPTGANQLPHTDGQTAHDLRIQRTGSSFTLYKKSSTDVNWVLLATYSRPDLPASVQVGLNIYTSVFGAAVADLSVVYSNISLVQ